MLARIWRKGNACALLMGMYITTAAVENCREFPQKLKRDPSYDPAIPLLVIYPKKVKTRS